MNSTRSSGAAPAWRRILIIDSHPLLRRGLTALIENEPDLIVCAEAATHRAGLEAIASARPDLVITDLSFGGVDGLGLIRDICSYHKDLPVLVLTMHDAPHYAERAFRAGARGYVTKHEMSETLLHTIRCVLDGQRYVNPKIGAGLECT
jgi:DNA-binding NarL/FixJ family response regulator